MNNWQSIGTEKEAMNRSSKVGHSVLPRNSRSGGFSSVFAAFIVILIMTLTAISLLPAHVYGADPETRAGFTYIGSIDGEGPDEDICLAGYQWYSVSYNFSGHSMEGLSNIDISLGNIGAGSEEWDFLSYDVFQGKILKVGFEGDFEAKDPILMFAGGSNFTFSFKIWFHLTWDHILSMKLTPSMNYGTETLEPDPAEELILDIEADIDEPDIGSITDYLGNEKSDRDPVRSNTTVYLNDVVFHYHNRDYDHLSPAGDELDPKILVDDVPVRMVWKDSGYFAELMMPADETGTVKLRASIDNIPKEYRLKLETWSISLKLDGMAPTLNLRTPSTPHHLESTSVFWEIRVTDQPTELKNVVNGSSAMYRVFNSNQWSEWIHTDIVSNDSSVFISGTTECDRGNTSKLQFRAMDILGNEVISKEFPIHVNVPPTIDLPIGVSNITLTKNQSLILTGVDFAADPDDATLTYEWYIDGGHTATGVNLTYPLYAESLGPHTIKLKVSDRYESREISFTINVDPAPEPEDNSNVIDDLLNSEYFIIILIPIALVIIVIILAVLIIALSKRSSSKDEVDFIVDEEAFGEGSSTDEITKRIEQMYGINGAVDVNGEAEAQTDMSGEEFDFDYNLYEILGLEPSATEVEIKKSYRKLAAYFHPDRVAMHKEIDPEEADETMLRINKAKEFLMDPERKARYDAHLDELEFEFDL